uniref:Macroglobulin domain-containing protein n=1 Tax=Timema poppense TaxID=170557 RepID=A0A7R9HA79_TIMPO|nr:unnamed protein product [Timema poppensis]
MCTSYFVVAPKTVRPGTLYGVVIHLVQGQHTALRVRVDISRQGVEVVSAAKTVVSHQVDTIFMKSISLTSVELQVPLSSVSGRYSLKVEGYLPDRSGERVFVNETEVIFSTTFLSIVVQTSRPIYNSGQLGVVSHKFKLPKLAKPGFWKIQVKAGEQVQEQPIRVEAYFPPQFEVQVLLPMYIVDSEEEIKATVAAKSELQRIVTGNASLALYGRNFRNNGTFVLIWQDKVFLVRSPSLVKVVMYGG